MSTNRCKFMLGSVSAAAAAAVPSPAAPNPFIQGAAKAITPYQNYPWKWWVGYDDAAYNQSFDTLAEALRFAEQEGFTHVLECRQQDYNLTIDGGAILEFLNDQNEDLCGEDEPAFSFNNITEKQIDDLGVAVTKAIENWAVRHKIDITAYIFAETRGKGVILYSSRRANPLPPKDY